MDDDYFNFDLDEMKKAMESKLISIPDCALEDIDAFSEWLDSNDFGERDD